MSQNKFVTSLNANTSAFITRQEVVQALSTIVPELSTLNISSLIFASPNPLFSTVTVNPNGQINGFAPIQTSNVIFAANSGLLKPANLRLGYVGNQSTSALCVTDSQNNLAPMRATNFIANAGSASGFAAGWAFSSNGFVTVDGNGVANPILTWQYGNSNTICLSNLSTINGVPVGSQIQTYTSLTGNNITNTQVIGTPSLVSVSSINGSNITTFTNTQTWVPYTVTVTGASNIAMVANVPQTVLQFNSLPITSAVGKYININVPIQVSPATGSVAAQTNVQLIAYIGGNVVGNTGVAGCCSLSPGTANSPRIVTLSGICAANGPTATLQIVAVSDQSLNLFFQNASYYNTYFFQQIV
jgi:hypothetical protein